MQRRRGAKRAKVEAPAAEGGTPTANASPVSNGATQLATKNVEPEFCPPVCSTSLRSIFEGEAAYGQTTTDKIQIANGHNVKEFYNQMMASGHSLSVPEPAQSIHEVDSMIEKILEAMQEDLNDHQKSLDKQLNSDPSAVKSKKKMLKREKKGKGATPEDMADVLFRQEGFEECDDVATDSEEDEIGMARISRYPPHIRALRRGLRNAKMISRDRTVNSQSIDVFSATEDLEKVAQANIELIAGKGDQFDKRNGYRQWTQAAHFARSVASMRRWEPDVDSTKQLVGKRTAEMIEKQVFVPQRIPKTSFVRALHEKFATTFVDYDDKAPLREALAKGGDLARQRIQQDPFRWYHAPTSFREVESGTKAKFKVTMNKHKDKKIYMTNLRQIWGRPGSLNFGLSQFSVDFSHWMSSLNNDDGPSKFEALTIVKENPKSTNQRFAENPITDSNLGFVRIGGGIGTLESNWSERPLNSIQHNFLKENSEQYASLDVGGENQKVTKFKPEPVPAVEGAVGVRAIGVDGTGTEYKFWGVDKDKVTANNKCREYYVVFDEEAQNCEIYEGATLDCFIERTVRENQVQLTKRHLPFLINGGPEAMRRVKNEKFKMANAVGAYVADADIEIMRKPQDLMVEQACHRDISYLRPRVVGYVHSSELSHNAPNDVPEALREEFATYGGQVPFDFTRELAETAYDHYSNKLRKLPDELFGKHEDDYTKLRTLMMNQSKHERTM